MGMDIYLFSFNVSFVKPSCNMWNNNMQLLM